MKSSSYYYNSCSSIGSIIKYVVTDEVQSMFKCIQRKYF